MSTSDPLLRAVALGALCALVGLTAACGDDSDATSGRVRIDRVEPPQAISGEVVRLYGDGFGARQPDDGRVSLRGVCAPVIEWTDQVVTIEIPTDAAGQGDTIVVLQRDGFASNPAALTLTGEGRFVAAVPCP